MRRPIGVLMLIVMSLLAVACSSSSDGTTTAPTSTTTNSIAATTTSTPPGTTSTSTTKPAGDLVVTIVEPAPLSTHLATIDLGNGRLAAPELGQHTEEVLLEAGFEWEEIAALRETGAI